MNITEQQLAELVERIRNREGDYLADLEQLEEEVSRTPDTYYGAPGDLEVQWNGEVAFIDVTIHDDDRPEDVPSIVAAVGLTLEEARAFRAELDRQIRNAEAQNSMPRV